MRQPALWWKGMRTSGKEKADWLAIQLESWTELYIIHIRPSALAEFMKRPQVGN
ncbi:MAG: hypothetical protein U5L07_10180 [Desulfobacterales bacterium]|nr:hypothetical protein [Desulfobacterales bacterium]